MKSPGPRKPYEQHLTDWGLSILRGPESGERLHLNDASLMKTDGTEVARMDDGVVRFPILSADHSIKFYRSAGGAHFHERSSVPFAMSALDTPIYQAWIDELLPDDLDAVVVDIGSGDGRNAWHCLQRGFTRVVVVDAVAEALRRFRARVAEQKPQWLDRLLLIEEDARSLPLVSACADGVLAVEVLCYFNEDYEIGLKECVRLMSRAAKILLSDRDYEGGLVLRLLYHSSTGCCSSHTQDRCGTAPTARWCAAAVSHKPN